MATSSTKAPGTSGRPGLRRATGRDYDEWFSLLDEWGAVGRPYREIAAWLTGEHGMSKWWAQKVIVEYEQSRGVRPAGVRRDGTFAAGASKTIAAPAKRVFEAFTDAKMRRRWLPDTKLRLRTSEQGRAARFDVEDGTRLNATFLAQGTTKSQVAVEHTHLSEAASVDAMKTYWRERLAALKSLLET